MRGWALGFRGLFVWGCFFLRQMRFCSKKRLVSHAAERCIARCLLPLCTGGHRQRACALPHSRPHLRPHPTPGPLHTLTPQVQYAQQCYDSKMVRMDRARGAARIAQDFVFADVRPLVARPLAINVYVTKSLE